MENRKIPCAIDRMVFCLFLVRKPRSSFQNLRVLLTLDNLKIYTQPTSKRMIIHTMPMAIETMMRRHVPFSFAIRSLARYVCITFSHNSFVSICKCVPMLLFILLRLHTSAHLCCIVSPLPSSDHILSEILKNFVIRCFFFWWYSMCECV